METRKNSDTDIKQNIEYLKEYLDRLKQLENIRLRKLQMISFLSKNEELTNVDSEEERRSSVELCKGRVSLGNVSTNHTKRASGRLEESKRCPDFMKISTEDDADREDSGIFGANHGTYKSKETIRELGYCTFDKKGHKLRLFFENDKKFSSIDSSIISHNSHKETTRETLGTDSGIEMMFKHQNEDKNLDPEASYNDEYSFQSEFDDFNLSVTERGHQNFSKKTGNSVENLTNMTLDFRSNEQVENFIQKIKSNSIYSEKEKKMLVEILREKHDKARIDGSDKNIISPILSEDVFSKLENNVAREDRSKDSLSWDLRSKPGSPFSKVSEKKFGNFEKKNINNFKDCKVGSVYSLLNNLGMSLSVDSDDLSLRKNLVSKLGQKYNKSKIHIAEEITRAAVKKFGVDFDDLIAKKTQEICLNTEKENHPGVQFYSPFTTFRHESTTKDLKREHSIIKFSKNILKNKENFGANSNKAKPKTPSKHTRSPLPRLKRKSIKLTSLKIEELTNKACINF